MSQQAYQLFLNATFSKPFPGLDPGESKDLGYANWETIEKIQQKYPEYEFESCRQTNFSVDFEALETTEEISEELERLLLKARRTITTLYLLSEENKPFPGMPINSRKLVGIVNNETLSLIEQKYPEYAFNYHYLDFTQEATETTEDVIREIEELILLAKPSPKYFAYCWSISNRIAWTKETAESLLKSPGLATSLSLEFLEEANPGDFIVLESGMLFCING